VTTLAPAPVGRVLGRSRAFLKVQEGCQHRCAFCVVPLARGMSRSLPPAAVMEQARRLVEAGHPEIVLTGVDLGHYGADLAPRTTLAALVRGLVDLRGVRWVRLSSVLPAYFTPELLDVVTGSPRVAPHFHLPLQSGSARVLRRMRRPYTIAMYRRLAERLVARMPRLGLGADVIVGFPGETDEDFAATMALVETLPFSYLHVFGYSERRGTEAAARADHVDARTIGRRSHDLRALADAKSLAFRRAMVGAREDVLVLETRERASGRLVGLTGNYVEVAFEGADDLMRAMTTVRVTSADGAGTRGVAREARPWIEDASA
jgi:threonylcarbamoyladenosine tRNA methylthiotransferase MtaB